MNNVEFNKSLSDCTNSIIADTMCNGVFNIEFIESGIKQLILDLIGEDEKVDLVDLDYDEECAVSSSEHKNELRAELRQTVLGERCKEK